jgi:PKD repeat protein
MPSWDVRLTVTNAGGSNTKTRTAYVSVSPARSISDTGLSQSDSIASTKAKVRAVVDLGVRLTYAVRLTVTNTIGSDTKTRTAYVQLERPARTTIAPRPISDAGVSHGDSVARTPGKARPVADTGLSFSEAVAGVRAAGHPRDISDSGLGGGTWDGGTWDGGTWDAGVSNTDSVARSKLAPRVFADTGLSFSESASRVVGKPRIATDAGLIHADATGRLVAVVRAASDTGNTFGDALDTRVSGSGAAFDRFITDAGSVFSETLLPFAFQPRDLNDTGLLTGDLVNRAVDTQGLELIDDGVDHDDVVTRRAINGRSIVSVGVTHADTTVAIINEIRPATLTMRDVPGIDVRIVDLVP